MLLNCGLEETLESPLNCEEIQPVHPKGNQSWIFIGRTDAEAETPILWPPDVKNWLIGKNPDAGKVWRQEKGVTEDEMVWWHHQLDGHEFQQALAVSDGQGGLGCCSHRVTQRWTRLSNRTEQSIAEDIHGFACCKDKEMCSQLSYSICIWGLVQSHLQERHLSLVITVPRCRWGMRPECSEAFRKEIMEPTKGFYTWSMSQRPAPAAHTCVK